MAEIYAEDIEQAVLGAMLLEKSGTVLAIGKIPSDEVFYFEKHKSIFNAACELFRNGNPVDILTVTNKLRNEKKLDSVGGAIYVTQLTSRISSTSNLEYHAAILIQKLVQRKLINLGGNILNESKNPSDVFETLNFFTNEILNIQNDTLQGQNQLDFPTQISKTYKELEAASKRLKDNSLSGLDTGLNELNKLTGGWQNSDLIIIGARPGMGKTAFIINNIMKLCKQGKRGLFFSLEMSYSRIVKRMISNEARIWGDKLNRGDLNEIDFELIGGAVNNMLNYKIVINDASAINVNYIRSVALQQKIKGGLDYIMIDYLQLMKGLKADKGNREQEISNISRNLKALAKELNIPIISLAQLGRDVEKRNNKRPILSDLRESGGIEQDADLVMFLYRPAYYYKSPQNDPDYKDKVYDTNDYLEVLELIIGKNREGAVDDFRTIFQMPYSYLVDYLEPANNREPF